MVQTNYLTRERTGALVTCDVSRVAVTSGGEWMATLEERDDGQTTAERRLKFWQFDDAKQRCDSSPAVNDGKGDVCLVSVVRAMTKTHVVFFGNIHVK